jgi:nucleotide-binding universal stress UspA family protein
MFHKVLVGVDERGGGRDAVALAKQLTAPGGKLTLAHVYRDEAAPRVRGYDEREAAEITRSRALLQTARAEAGVDARLRWTGSASVGRGLHELAEMLEADLLVVGSTRRGLVGRVLLSDDTRAALDGAPCAVAIAPSGYAGHARGIGKIGVGYDGSPDSEGAAIAMKALASELGATPEALQVVFFPAYLFSGPVAGDATTIHDLIEQAREQVASLGGVEPHGAYGQPAEELARWSAELDLLVVGSRGYGPIGRLVHGSTSQELARRARCPLLVITRPPRETIEPDDALRGYEVVAGG